MVAFLSSALEMQMKKLCRIVLKGSILNKAATACLLTQVTIEKNENQLSIGNIKLDTKLNQILSWDLAVRSEKKRVQDGVCLDSGSNFEEA